MATESARINARQRRHRDYTMGIPRPGPDSNSLKAWKEARRTGGPGAELDYPEYSEQVFNAPLASSSSSISSSSVGFGDMGDVFSAFSKASDDIKIAFGMDQPTSIIGPNPNGTFPPTWNQLDDVDDEQLKLLKSVFGVVSREELVKKLQEQAGLRTKTIHPLQLQRQASFMNNLTRSHNDCDWSRYVIPTQGFIGKSHKNH